MKGTKKIHKYNKLIQLSLLSLSLSGCFSSFTPKEDSFVVDSSGNNPLTLTEGITLYNTNCVSCHGGSLPGTRSEKDNKTASDISLAINMNKGGMNSLSFLTQAQLDAIALALQFDPNGGGQPGISQVKFKASLGTRYYMASSLESIFISNNESNISSKITSLVANQTAAFGGSCTRYDGNCTGTHDTNINAPQLPSGNVIRKGYTTRACEEILNINQSVINALGKVGLTTSSAANDNNVDQIFGLFYPGRIPTNTVISDLKAIHADATTKGMSGTDAWRFTLLPLCLSANSDLL